jgi:hypothetical protein
VRRHVFIDRGSTDVDAELQSFAVDPGRAPKRIGGIGDTHCHGSTAEFPTLRFVCRHGISTYSARTSENWRVRTNNGLRLYYRQGVHNAGCNPIEASENQPTELAERKPHRRFSSQNCELVAQR